jgi:kynureninase
MDQEDLLRSYRDYLSSQKIKPRSNLFLREILLASCSQNLSRIILTKELGNWAEMAADGHFDGGGCHYMYAKSKPAMKTFGAYTHEVVATTI